MEKCAVVIPVYRDRLEPVEKFSLDNNICILNDFPIYLLMPENLPMKFFQEYSNLRILRFDDAFFVGYQGYSRLLMSEGFYQAFANYEKILICQLDAYVFEDRLEYFFGLPYDYIGAPAFLEIHEDGSYVIQPGNGGFSLRDVKNTLDFLRNHSSECNAWKGTEDAFFSFCGMRYPGEFRMAPTSVAASFAFDRYAPIMYEWKQHQLPVGIHAWQLYAQQFFVQLLPRKSQQILNRILKKWLPEDIMKPFYSFLARHSRIVLYGTGEWGQVIGRALQILNVCDVSFAISDGQEKQGEHILGIPIYYWSEIDILLHKTGVIMSISQKYRDVEEMDGLHHSIRARGVEDILDVDNQMFNFIGEIILREGGFP